MFISYKGSFRRTGLSLFLNLQKDNEEWTEEDQLMYLQAKIDELILKDAEQDEESSESETEETEPIKEHEKAAEGEGVVNDVAVEPVNRQPKPTARPRKRRITNLEQIADNESQTKLTNFFRKVKLN
jgi:TolA-binding protein